MSESKLEQFERIFAEDGLGRAADRLAVLRAFLQVEGHVTARELTRQLPQGGESLDDEFVAATLALFCRYGLAFERQFEHQDTTYEHRHLREHHDHLICVKCGAIQEFNDPEIERQQRLVAQRYGFRTLGHRLEMYGLCSKCATPVEQAFPLTMAVPGERVTVAGLRAGPGMQQHLTSMGLRPGEEILVINSGQPGPFLVAVGPSRVALGHGLAHRVMVVRR